MSAFLKICSKPRNFRLFFCQFLPLILVSFFFFFFVLFFLHRQVDGGVQPQAALVGAESGVELHTVAAVGLEVAGIIFPNDAELDDTLGDRDDLERGAVLGVLLEERGVLEGEDELWKKFMSVPKSSQMLSGIVSAHPCRPARTRARWQGETWWLSCRSKCPKESTGSLRECDFPGYRCRLKLGCENAEGKERAKESTREAERAQTIYQRVCGWDGGGGRGRRTMGRWDGRRNHVALAPRTCRPKEAAAVGGLGNS